MTKKIKIIAIFAAALFLCLGIGWLLYIHFGHELIKEAELLFFVATAFMVLTCLLAIVSSDVFVNLVITISSFIGVMLVLACTIPYGVGMCPDGITYITVAKSLLAGHGYVCYRPGCLLIDFPPLFSTVLAILGLTGIDLVMGARIFNAIVFGAVIFVSGYFFRIFIHSRALVILGAISILLSVPLLFVSTSAWSEPLFILLVVSFIICLYKFLSEKRWSILLLLSTIVAFSCMQRYIGVTLALSGFLSIILLLPKTSFVQKLKYGTVFCVISVTPLFIWIARNYILGKSLLNLTFPRNFGLVQNIYSTFDGLTVWLMPREIPFPIRIIAIVLIMVLIMYVRFYLCSKRNRDFNKEVIKIVPIGIFMAIYTISLIGTASWIDADKIEDRYLSPLYVFFIFLILIGIDGILDLLSKSQKKIKAANSVAVVLFALWLVYPFGRVLKETSRWMLDGFQVYTTAAWRHSPFINWLRTHQLDGTIYSNSPNAIYLLTDKRADTSHKKCHGTYPEDSKEDELNKFKESFKLNKRLNKSMYLVWFLQRSCKEYKCTIEDLRSVFVLEEVAVLSDGMVYLFKSEK